MSGAPAGSTAGVLDALYGLLLGVVGLIGAVVGWFFLVGLADGSAARFAAQWLLVWAVLAGVPGGAIGLRRRRRTGLAAALLALVGVPGALIVVMAVRFFLGSPNWQ